MTCEAAMAVERMRHLTMCMDETDLWLLVALMFGLYVAIKLIPYGELE